ncbi:MAG TPA: hypothetical protein VF808_18800 [Ktedonobacterales bacterium]
MTTEARRAPCVCLVTIHGIGFEQRPTANQPMSGYADVLHARLSRALNSGDGPPLISDDPTTQRPPQDGAAPGVAGPIYVESAWPVGTHNREAGLKRLGVWRSKHKQQFMGAVEAGPEAALTAQGLPIAHVALVYSHLEGESGNFGDVVEAVGKVAGAFSNYQNVFGAIHMAFNDVVAMARPPHRHDTPIAQAEPLTGQPSLRVRADAAHHLPRFGRPPLPKHEPAPSPTFADIVLQLQDDVATYVCRNDLRQRVRGFVRDALLRLIYREDVAGIVINAHSHGSVVALDVLSELSPFEARKIWWLITAGSPQRKYVNLFAWEREIGALREVGLRDTAGRNQAGDDVLPLRWVNFWDPRDPVGDPLRPVTLRDQIPEDYSDSETLYRWIDPMEGSLSHVALLDRKVSNVDHVRGGGLRAHNYWDNEPEFIAPVAGLLRHLVKDRLRGQTSAATPPSAATIPPSPDDTLILKN